MDLAVTGSEPFIQTANVDRDAEHRNWPWVSVLIGAWIRTCHWCDHRRIVERRTGDVPARKHPPKAQTLLGWKARRNLEDMCRDGWAWQQANPMGYQRKA